MSELENQADDQLQEEYLEDNYQEEYEEVEEVSEEEDEYPADLAPDSEPEHEENSEDDEPQMSERAQEVINMKHRKMKEAQEENERLRQQLQQAQAYQQQSSQPPQVPDIPDAFDDDYDAKIRQRDEAIIRFNNWQNEQAAISQRNQQRQIAQQQEEARKLQESSNAYVDRAKKQGIKPEMLQQSAQVIAQYLDDNNPSHVELSRRVLADESGPLITQYLASHSLELADIAEMHPIDAALHIETKIKPKLKGFTKKTKAPRPARRAGGAAPKPDSNRLAGAKFY